MANQIETIVNVQRDNRNRVTTLFRGILVFPVLFYIVTLSQTFHWGAASGMVTFPIVLTLLFRGVYPSYLLSFNHAIMELSLRLISYMLLLTDEYPSIERNPNMAILFPDVQGGKKLSRWQPLVKFILAIPLYIVGIFYSLISAICTVFAAIHIILFKKYPDPVINIVLGTLKYWNRVIGYAGILVTDEYPSFKLNA